MEATSNVLHTLCILTKSIFCSYNVLETEKTKALTF